MPRRYPIPWSIARKVVTAALLKRQRSFRADARKCVEEYVPDLRISGREHIPTTGRYVVTINHYSRPGLQSWWMTLVTSSVIPDEIHWIMTASWAYPDPLRARSITPATSWAFRRVAEVYGFTTMPPMPPDPRDVVERARAVRRVLSYARRSDAVVIGLAPEGRDNEGGVLRTPPSGVGRFIQHFNDLGLRILPVGIYENQGELCMRLGPAYPIEIRPGLPPDERDRQISRAVMEQIACQLPGGMRGIYG